MTVLTAWWFTALLACNDKGDDPTGDSGPAASDSGDEPSPDDTQPTDSDADSGSQDTEEPDCYLLSNGDCVEQTFSNPPLLEADADGVYTITMAPAEITLGDQRHCLRAYNGSYPGPTLETEASDDPRQIRIDLVNGFAESDFRDLTGDDTCVCTDDAGAECAPSHGDHGSCTCTNSSGEACTEMFDFNLTNLHAHGGHLRPDYSRGGEACTPGTTDSGGTLACRACGEDGEEACYHADDVISAIQPGDGAQYRWDIDEDGTHHDGLQWYHPHIHGTTGIQVSSGAAGAWITRGALDEVSGMSDATERIMVFSTPPIGEDAFEPLAEGEECSEETITFNNFHTLAATSAKQYDVINDVWKPRLVTAPGQVERWRIVHAGFLDEVFMGLAKGDDPNCESWSSADDDLLPLTQIARDGLTLPASYTSDYLFMSPGYRIEALVGGDGVFEDGDTWCLVAARFLQEDTEFPISPTEAPTTTDILDALRNVDGAKLAAIVNVTASAGEPTLSAMPDLDAIAATGPSTDLDGQDIEALCAAAEALEDPADIDQVAVMQVGVFTTQGVDETIPCECDSYNINCKNFERVDRSLYPYDRDLPLDAVEHWRVDASFDGHPFHIHINPFVVCPQDNVFDPIPVAHWRDTYLINLNRRADVLTQYKSYTGAFVTHCHKLHHEDHGMMQLLRVCDPDEDATCGDHHWRTCAEGDVACEQQLAATDCAITAADDTEALACITAEGLPGGACELTVCDDDDECLLPGQSCLDGVCQ